MWTYNAFSTQAVSYPISEAAYERCQTVASWPELPLQRTKVKGASVGRNLEVRRQAEVEFSCQGRDFVANSIVVPSLVVDMLLGVKFLVANHTTLHFGESEARL